jgi:hypothetical protein
MIFLYCPHRFLMDSATQALLYGPPGKGFEFSRRPIAVLI